MLFARSPLVSTSRCWVWLRSGLALAATLGLPGTAAAEPGSDRPPPESFLLWQAPVGCSTAAAVRERVSELLGEPELDLRQVRRVEGRVTEATNGWTLHLTLVGAAGRRERTLGSEHCQDLAEAAAVAISLAFEAARAGAESGSDSMPSPEAASPTPIAPLANAQPAGAAAEAANAPPAEGPSDGGRLRAELGAELLLDGNSLPIAAPGVALVGALRWSALRLAVFGVWLPDATESVAPEQDVSFSLLSAGLRACYTLGRGLVDTSLCAGAEIGRVSASGAGLFLARSVSDLWIAPQVGLELGVPLGQAFAVLARVDALAPLQRQRYAVNETDDVHQTPSVALRVALGASLAF